jgi:hypothetical protein
LTSASTLPFSIITIGLRSPNLKVSMSHDNA